MFWSLRNIKMCDLNSVHTNHKSLNPEEILIFQILWGRKTERKRSGGGKAGLFLKLASLFISSKPSGSCVCWLKFLRAQQCKPWTMECSQTLFCIFWVVDKSSLLCIISFNPSSNSSREVIIILTFRRIQRGWVSSKWQGKNVNQLVWSQD